MDRVLVEIRLDYFSKGLLEELEWEQLGRVLVCCERKSKEKYKTEIHTRVTRKTKRASGCHREDIQNQ